MWVCGFELSIKTSTYDVYKADKITRPGETEVNKDIFK